MLKTIASTVQTLGQNLREPVGQLESDRPANFEQRSQQKKCPRHLTVLSRAPPCSSVKRPRQIALQYVPSPAPPAHSELRT